MVDQLKAEHLACMRGDRLLFSGLDFSLRSGELLYVSGENGAGKSSLLRVLSGLAMPAQGTVFWSGGDVGKRQEAYRRDMLLVSHTDGMKDELSIAENLRFASRLARQDSQDAGIGDALVAVGLGAYADERAGSLSQGQRRRAGLARLWLSQARLWLLDEPFVSLDKASVSILAERIRQHLAAGGMVVLTSHQAVDIQAGAVHRLHIA
ncbi:cytochrome c biogenesis heme-transporting ATPase CcmA [Methylobacillus sp. Pita1]|uniref:cytochrome c biogenesis heme-transporting ATPase CcmA n=1 Tax=Methylobacillus sp. Pita1 TaxID=3382642 RepID=UPI0038B4BADD